VDLSTLPTMTSEQDETRLSLEATAKNQRRIFVYSIVVTISILSAVVAAAVQVLTDAVFHGDSILSTTRTSLYANHHNPPSQQQQQQHRRSRRRRLTESSSTGSDGQILEIDNEKFIKETLEAHLPLFEVSDTVSVLGPTEFPKPTYMFHSKGSVTSSDGKMTHKIQPDDDIVTHIKPVSGTHRPDQDAVLIFAAEYPLSNYILFLSTLRLEAKFDGDVVMAISPMDWEDKAIREYLEDGHPNVIVYVVKYSCYNAEGEDVASSKGGARVCLCHDLYAKRTGDGPSSTTTPLPDPRHPRTVQNSRYELYWIWATNYDPTSWIMLIDARDTIFASDPFVHVPRRKNSKDIPLEGGLLLFFGENVDATRLGQSRHNRNWLTKAYGDDVVKALQKKPTICSGSTMGEQQAVEAYLRAMVAESDETETVLTGADQGFHNYLYYSNKLSNAVDIREIIVQDQGFGIINNMGALRTKELNEWGNGKILETIKESGNSGKVVAHNVRNWDGTISPVVHQFDRHKVLASWWYKKKAAEYRTLWDERKAQKKLG
jgi:hypothetical protein